MIKELLTFLFANKKWWLIPPIVILIGLGILIIVSVASPVNPFAYMLF